MVADRAEQVSVRRESDRAPLRVCHVIHSLGRGGAEHLLVTLAQVVGEAGVEFAVVSLMPDEDVAYASRLRELGIEVRSLGLRSRWDPRALPRAARLIGAQRPDLVHTHLKHADLVGAFVARRLRVPLVSTLHMIEDAPRGLERFKRRVAAQVRLRVAARTITVSDAQRAWYQDTFAPDPARIATVRNGVLTPREADSATSMRQEFDISPESVLAVVVSILRPGKGHEDLLEALQSLPEDLDLRVVIAGDGPRRQSLENTVRENAALGRRVVFAGFVDRVEDLLAVSDMIIHPSHFDALPTALIYASAAGLPAVATEVGGIPEIVTPGTGILVPPRDPSALAAGIEKLARDAALRSVVGLTARERFEMEFDARVWAGRLREVYDSVLEESLR